VLEFKLSNFSSMDANELRVQKDGRGMKIDV